MTNHQVVLIKKHTFHILQKTAFQLYNMFTDTGIKINKKIYNANEIRSRDTGTYDGAYIGSVFLTFSKGFIVYFDNSFGCSFGCITVSETLVFFQLNNIFESQN